MYRITITDTETDKVITDDCFAGFAVIGDCAENDTVKVSVRELRTVDLAHAMSRNSPFAFAGLRGFMRFLLDKIRVALGFEPVVKTVD